MRSLTLALVIIAALAGCDDSPTETAAPEEEVARDTRTTLILDDGTGKYLDGFKESHDGALCSPKRIIAYGPTEAAKDTLFGVVEYSCEFLVR